jgi:hypothetical protein
VLHASPRAAARLGVTLERVRGTPVGMLADLDGDPLVDGVITVTTGEGRVPALSVGDADGRTLVLGSPGVPAPETAARPARKLVHDMSNVLGIMRGRAELVEMQSSDENVRRSMEEIQKAADRALEILEKEIPAA